MLLSFYQELATLFYIVPGQGYLNLSVDSGRYLDDFSLANNLAHIFLFSDALSYVGIVCVVALIGSTYSSSHSYLTRNSLFMSELFCYCSLLLNVAGLVYGVEFISMHVINIFSGLYTFSFLTQIFKILLLLLMLALYTYFPSSSSTQLRTLEIPLLMQITSALCITILSANNFALILLALEGFSLTLYVMTALGRTYGGITASVKYFAFGTLGSIFLFWGVVHVYALIPTLSLEIINVLLSDPYRLPVDTIAALDFATTAIVLGFMIKLGAAPTHQWVADTYAGVHIYITAYFSIFVKCVLFLIFIKTSAKFNCDALITEFTILSLLIGCFMSINQSEIKRLLAYSSIVHVGFLLMGDAPSSLIYLVTYLVSSLVIFSVLLNNELAGRELVYFNDLKHIRISGSFNIFSLVIALASSAGLPPFAGFYGKFLVWTSLIEDIYVSNSFSSYATLFTSVAITLVTIFYYMRIIAYLFVGADRETYSVNSVWSAADFYSIIFSMQGFLTCTLILWTFAQPYMLVITQMAVAFL